MMFHDFSERYGGASGLRDPGQLEAAALWESLSQNHPFVDGNKRTAFAATYTFLAINGWRLTAEPEATYTFMLWLYESSGFHFEAQVSWLRLNTQRVP